MAGCGFGTYLKHLGITNHLTRGTIYGDWGCSVFKLKNPLGKRSIRDLEPGDFEEEILGRFCADAGMVTVVLLDEVLKYNPNFNYHTSRPWTATVIKDFHGDVYDKVINRELFLVGEGNINFIARQTSL